MVEHNVEDKISALTTKDPAKLQVYIDHYDGHCLRAYSYFGNTMPDIRQALDTDKAYKVTIDGEEVSFLGSDAIKFNGKEYTGNELYRIQVNQRV